MTVLSRESFEVIADQIMGEIREDYSGRGMYGEVGPAIVTEQVPDLASVGVMISHVLMLDANKEWERDEATERALEISSSVRTDNMGLGYVVYFPGLILK